MGAISNSFKAVKRLQAEGKTFKDDDGAFYLVDHDHPAIAGREFVNPNEMATAIKDYNTANPKQPFQGEIILLNIITYN
jgi:hypothetical protein